MLASRLVIGVAMFILMCGQFLVWRRRDNVLGYLQLGTYLSTIAVPLFGTDIITNYNDHIVALYARVLVLGAATFALGLSYGGFVGRRSVGRIPLTFALPLTSAERTALVWRRARWGAMLAGAALVAAYALLGYVPILAADTRLAKYGIGAYAGGFARARVVYLFALTSAAALLPVVAVLFYRHRRLLDLALVVGLQVGLLCSLSRGLAFLGPITAVAAIAVERRVKVPVIVAGVVACFFAGIVFNQLTLASDSDRPPFAILATISAPDVLDHFNFLRGYDAVGRPENHGRTILAGLDPRGGEDGSSYALRTATGVQDLSTLASGGLRLPAPVWGYTAFGLWGTAAWCFISGFFSGWGATKLKKLLTASLGQGGQSLNLVLAVLVYNGTFGILEQFYFTSTAGFVLLAWAVVIGIRVRFPVRRSGATAAEADERRAARRSHGVDARFPVEAGAASS